MGLLLAEVGVRLFGPPPGPRYQTFFLDADRRPTTLQDAVARGEVDPSGYPRDRPRWTKPATYYVCYRHGRQPSMDQDGCIRVEINKFGLRDRADLTLEKPEGQSRILCLGDSFTAGWGVGVEYAWPRLLEASLGRPEVRTVNCGLAGTLLIDESWWGLRDRFANFEPDVVLLTICLNDLAPIPGVLGLFRSHTLRGCSDHGFLWSVQCGGCAATFQRQHGHQAWFRWSRLASIALDTWDYHKRMDLDPAQDWGRWLLELPANWPPPRSHYEQQGIPFDARWNAGAPQAALASMRDWCQARNVAFGVVLWPLFQGLETSERYPFKTMHRVVQEFCDQQKIALLDLLPVFLGQDSASLWVDPCDMHANEAAHALAAPPIAGFVDQIWPPR